VVQPRCAYHVLAATMATMAAARAGAAPTAAMGQAAVDRMIDLNRKAYVDLQSQRYQAAKYWLTEALVISETAGLDNDEMTARTYVHMAVFQLGGLKDREEAIHQFSLALKINPNITISAGLETPALKSAYLQARERMGLPPNPDTSLEPVSPSESDTAPIPAASGHAATESASTVRGELDPDLPARVPAALYCPLPFEIPAGKDLLVRCLTQKHQKRASATFYYRHDAASSTYVALPMAHSPKGWLIAVVPGTDVQGRSLSYYAKAQLPGTTTSLYNGHPEVPNALLIRAPTAAVASAPSRATTGDWPPTAASGGRDRPAGAIWFALAAGTGAVYHAREPVDSNTKVLGSTNPVYVESGFSPATLFELEPELGYQLSRYFSLSLLMRYQYAPKDGAPGAGENAIRTSAFAGFLRSQVLFSGGNFQPYLSVGAGLGTSFLAVISKRCASSANCALDHSDTLHGGVFGLTGGMGIIYHFSSSLGLIVDLKEILTMPKVMALTEINLGFEVAYDVRGAAKLRHAETRDPDEQDEQLAYR
jgi:hypothetical protein